MTTFTLPAPVFVTARPKSRYRTINYPLGPKTQTAKGGTEQRVVQVHVGHLKERKQFYATANKVTIEHEPEFGFNVEQYWPFDAVTLMRQPVARFSDKALAAFTATVVKFFESQVVVTPKLLAMFNTDGEPA
jgi:hypothetical protein